MESKVEQSQEQETMQSYLQGFIRRNKKNKIERECESTPDLKYVIYTRRSTEDDVRQLDSIQQQVDVCKEFADRAGLNYANEEIIKEEKSAKVAGKRKKFSKMIEDIKIGERYNAIIAWHPDRLSRNMKESGELLDMLDKGTLLDLKFVSCAFTNDAAGKMTLSILFAMAKEFSDKLSVDTKRGLSKKAVKGMYCGVKKKGYYVNKEKYYRPNDTYKTWASLWKMILDGKTQVDLAKYLESNGIKLNKNTLTNFFRDPFYAGWYCFGDSIVETQKVDSRFQPMVSVKDFLAVRRKLDEPARGWKLSNEFRPFNELIVCADCGKYMTAGLPKGKSEKYLRVTCGNSKCKENRREKGISPVTNDIRGREIIEYSRNFLANQLTINRELYEKAKQQYRDLKVDDIDTLKIELQQFKRKLTLESQKMIALKEKFITASDPDLLEELRRDYSELSASHKITASLMSKKEKILNELVYSIGQSFPSFDDFLNSFSKADEIITKTDNDVIIDQVVRLLFLNITAGDKKVVKVELREPFKSFAKLKFTQWVSY